MSKAQEVRQKNRDKQGKYTAYEHAKPSIRLGVPNMNSGYVGYSMSLRAMEAYEDGEMPKSKWTKNAMLGAIWEQVEDENNAEEFMDYISSMKKDKIFDEFFYNSSWHHTGKYANVTDFYTVDEDNLTEYRRLWSLPREEKEVALTDFSKFLDTERAYKDIQERYDQLTSPYDIRPKDYVKKAQQYCESVQQSGILDAPKDMYMAQWIKDNPQYREPYGERNGYEKVEDEQKDGRITIGFEPKEWYSSAYGGIPIDAPIGLFQERLKQDVVKRQERVDAYYKHQQSLEENKEEIERLKKERKRASDMYQNARESLKDKYSPEVRRRPYRTIRWLKGMLHGQ